MPDGRTPARSGQSSSATRSSQKSATTRSAQNATGPRKNPSKSRAKVTFKRSKETNEWIGAGALFGGLILALVLGLHFIGGASTTAGAATANSFGAGGNGFNGGGGFGAIRTATVSAVATALGIPSATLTTDLQSGETVAQIASAQGVEIATVNTAYLNAVQQTYAQEVTSGTITQTQADQIYSQQQQAVANGQYSFLTSRFGNPTPTPSS